MKSFDIDIPQADLDDLRDRLDRVRWDDQLPGEGWDRGVPVDYLRDLVEYWRTAYDWRAQEKALNRFPQFTTTIDGLEIHFLHVRSPEPDALPLILTHGWPNSFVEFTRTIDLLTDPGGGGTAFHVVVPSVPGFGFSGKPRSTGMSVEKVAGLWVELMTQLGYTRFGVQGGDLGAYVSPAVAAAAPSRVVGVHLDGGIGFPTEADVPDMSEEDLAFWGEMQKWMSGGTDHHGLLRVAPQTFANGWTDSPVALLSWMLQKFNEFTPTVDTPEQAIDRDLILTNTMIYWLTRTTGSSSWFMYNNTSFTWPVGQRDVPTGVYGPAPPLMRRLAARSNNVVHWPEANPGGHFVAMEEPAAHAADIREFFSQVR